MKTLSYTKHSDAGYVEPLAGIRQKTLVFGERMLMAEFVLGRGSVLPGHSHPYEQTGYLVRGHIVLTIGQMRHDTRPGDSWCIPPGVSHGAEIFEDSVAIEIFSPVRPDYIPQENT